MLSASKIFVLRDRVIFNKFFNLSYTHPKFDVAN